MTRVPKSTGPLRAAIYIRVSGKSQEDNTSLESQEAICRELIAQEGWVLDEAHVYREVYSGRYLGRTQLDRLRVAIQGRQLDRIVVWHSDRFGRDPDEQKFLKVEAKIHGARYVSATDDDPDTPEGKLVGYVKGYAAKKETERFAARSQQGRDTRMTHGKRLVGCKAPYGYRWTSDRDEKDKPVRSGLVLDEAEAAIVRRIFQHVAAGRSMRSVAEALNREGVPTPNPKRCKPGHRPIWYIKTIHDMMDNPVYLGRAIAFRQEAPVVDDHTGRRVPRKRPEAEWREIDGCAIPALVDQETWDRAQARRVVNRERSARTKAEHKDALLMGGIARCAYCGTALHVNRRDGKRVTYRCGTKQPKPGCREEGRVFGTCMEAKNLDREVWMAVEHILRNPRMLAAQMQAMVGAEAEAHELATIREGLADLDRQEANVTEAIAQSSNAATISALTKKLDGLAEKRSTLKRQEADAQLRHWARQAAVREANDLVAWAERERAKLAGLDFDGKRERLERLGVTVHVSRPGAFEGRWALTIAPQGITIGDLRAGQSLRGGNCETYPVG